MAYIDKISQMTLEEKVAILEGKAFWKTNPILRFEMSSIYMTDDSCCLRKHGEIAVFCTNLQYGYMKSLYTQNIVT